MVRAPFELARAPFELARAPFELARAPFELVRAPFESARAPFESACAPFESARAPFESVRAPFESVHAPVRVVRVSWYAFPGSVFVFRAPFEFVVRSFVRSWFVVRGSRFVVRGSWFVVRGSWFAVRGVAARGVAARVILDYSQKSECPRQEYQPIQTTSHMLKIPKFPDVQSYAHYGTEPVLICTPSLCVA